MSYEDFSQFKIVQLVDRKVQNRWGVESPSYGGVGPLEGGASFR